MDVHSVFHIGLVCCTSTTTLPYIGNVVSSLGYLAHLSSFLFFSFLNAGLTAD